MPESAATAARTLRELLELLGRTMKTVALYDGANPVSEKLEAELHRRFSELLDTEGHVELTVQQQQILFDDEVICEAQGLEESLPSILSRDGIRGLDFRSGLGADELHRFVSCLNRGRSKVTLDDDLATLLWEEDFESIGYVIIDELSDTATSAEMSGELVGSGWRSVASQSQPHAPAGGALSLDDMSPSTRLPQAGFELSESELEALHLELAREREADLPRMVVELAIELVMLEPNRDEQRAVAETLAGVLDEFLRQERPAEFLKSIELLLEHAEKTFAASSEAQELCRVVLDAVSGRKRLGRFLSCVAGRLELVEGVEQFLRVLPEAAVPTLIDGLAAMRHPRLRRAVSDAVLVHGDRGPLLLLEQLPTLRAAGTNQVVDELFRMIRLLPSESACTLIERLVTSGDTALARRSTLILGQLRGQRAKEALLHLLETGGADTRSLAIGALARTDDPSLAPRLLEKALESGESQLDSTEIGRLLPAIGRFGGDLVLPALKVELETQSRGWVASRERRRLVRALVRGISAVGSSAARGCLEELAGSGSRLLRGVCREELSGGDYR